jgi:hypothetical protein
VWALVHRRNAHGLSIGQDVDGRLSERSMTARALRDSYYYYYYHHLTASIPSLSPIFNFLQALKTKKHTRFSYVYINGSNAWIVHDSFSMPSTRDPYMGVRPAA